jgi:hypothetical protein
MIQKQRPWTYAWSLVLVAGLPWAAMAQTEPAPSPSATPTLPDKQAEPPLLPVPTPERSPEGSTPALDSPSIGGFSPLFNAAVGHALFRTDYRATWFPEERVAGQPTNLGYVEQDFSLSFPLWQNGTEEWSAATNVRSELFQTHAVLLNTRQEFPEELWNIRFSTTYRHLFDNGWIGGGSVSFGSASDRPFASIDEMTAGVNGFLRIPQGEHNAWLLTLSYSSNSQLPIPIPGAAFVWQPCDQFRANIGLPFQLMYRPWEDLTLDLSYMLLTNVHARATYRLSAPLRVYLGYDWQNEAYLLADRPDVNDRFFYYDQRLTGGIQFNANKHLGLDLSSGYVFNRFYFEGRQLSDSHFNRIDVGDGPFLSLQCHLRW